MDCPYNKRHTIKKGSQVAQYWLLPIQGSVFHSIARALYDIDNTIYAIDKTIR